MSETPQLVAFDDFKRLQLIIATIVSVELHPNADKLYVIKLALDGGDSTRQVVAGIRQFYVPEQLIGRQVVLVANLEPKMIRGVESHGMLLAAHSNDETVVVISPERQVSPGSPVS